VALSQVYLYFICLVTGLMARQSSPEIGFLYALRALPASKSPMNFSNVAF